MSIMYRQKKFMFPPPVARPPPIPPEKAIEMALTSNQAEFEAFIVQNKELINMKDERGNVTMHVAASRGMLEMMAFLIRKGANIDIQDIYGNTPLLYAIDKNQVDAVEMLIKNGANVHITDFRGNSPLHSACSQNNKVCPLIATHRMFTLTLTLNLRVFRMLLIMVNIRRFANCSCVRAQIPKLWTLEARGPLIEPRATRFSRCLSGLYATEKMKASP